MLNANIGAFYRKGNFVFEKFKRLSAASRKLEELLYEQVIIELSAGHRRDGLWGKAIAKSEGSNERAKSLYIQYRVQALRDEIKLGESTNSSSSADTRHSSQKRANESSVEKSIPVQAPTLTSLNTEDLIFRLLQQLSDYSSFIEVMATVNALEHQGFDLENTELIITDRAGPEERLHLENCIKLFNEQQA